MAKLLAQLEDEDNAPKLLMRSLRELEKDEERLTALVDAKPTDNVIRLPTNYEAVYGRAIDELSMHLASPDATRTRKSVRQIITKVVVGPGDARGGRVRPWSCTGTCSASWSSRTEQQRHKAQNPIAIATG